MPFTYEEEKRCHNCGHTEFIRIPLIDAIKTKPASEFGEDVKAAIAALQQDWANVLRQSEKMARLMPDKPDVVKHQLELAEIEIEKRAAKILRIRPS